MKEVKSLRAAIGESAAKGGLESAVDDSGHLSKKKRVLIYGMSYSPEPIGVGRYTGDLGSYLAQRALVDVVAAVPHYPGWSVRDGYSNRYSVEIHRGAHITRCPIWLAERMHGIRRVLAPMSFAITSAPVAMWRILTTRPNCIVCIEPTLFSAPIAVVCGKIVRARTVLHVQDLEIDAAFAVGHIGVAGLKRAALWFETWMLRRFTSIVTISNGMRDALRKKGVPSTRLNVIRNWVDTEKIRPSNLNSQVRDELGLPSDAFIALYSGNIGLKQTLPVLLDTAEEFLCRSDVIFVVAGEGPEKKGLMSRYGHLPNVRFLPVQPEEYFRELLCLADLHILPQHPHTNDMMFPSKLGGMLASGKPCVVMASPGTELYEFLSGAAVLVPPGDRGQLAAAITDLVNGNVTVDRVAQLQLAERLDAKHGLEAFSSIVLNGLS